jgi:tRNA/rRNA methyltransferase
MANFGCSRLILINPKCQINQESKNLAKHAQEILANAQLTNWSVLDEFRVVAATTGVLGTDYNLVRTPLFPEEGCAKLAQSKNAAIIFGRESSGLRTKEIARAHFVITIPTTRLYSSMNLSHAVAVVLYTYFRQAPVKRFAPMLPVEARVMERRLHAIIGALPFRTDAMRETQKKLWKNIFGRAMLTRREAFAAFGFLSALEKMIGLSPQRKTAPKAAIRRRARN